MSFILSNSAIGSVTDFFSVVVAAEVTSINLSKATSLGEAEFRLLSLEDVAWAGSILKTLTSEHKDLRRISIHITIRKYVDVQQVLGTEVRNLWTDLDRTLIQLWESNATTTRVTCATGKEGMEARKVIEQLLPEMPGRVIVNVDRW